MFHMSTKKQWRIDMGEISGYPIFPQPKAAKSHHILGLDFNPILKFNPNPNFNPNPIPKFGQ